MARLVDDEGVHQLQTKQMGVPTSDMLTSCCMLCRRMPSGLPWSFGEHFWGTAGPPSHVPDALGGLVCFRGTRSPPFPRVEDMAHKGYS